MLKPSNVPELIDQLEGYREWSDTRLRAALEHAEEPSSRIRASLALLPVDRVHVEFLCEQLLQADPAEFGVILRALTTHREAVTDKLWATALRETEDGPRFFRAACALATCAPDDAGWDQIAAKTAELLVSQNSLVLSAWMESLRPVKEKLIKPLSVVYRDRRAERAEETAKATDVLIDYARKQRQKQRRSLKSTRSSGRPARRNLAMSHCLLT